jgi:hypothetical protein
MDHFVVFQRVVVPVHLSGRLFCSRHNGAKKRQGIIALSQPESIVHYWHVGNLAWTFCLQQ